MKLQRGRQPNESLPEVSDIRELTRGDLLHLTEKRPANGITAIRDNHHRIARCVASGLTNTQTAQFCGIGYNRVSQLRADPSFQELVAHYRGMLTREWIEAADPVIEFLGSIRTKSLAMIEDKIDAAAEAGEFLPSRDLATFAELGLDRTGYGKVNKNVNVNVDFAANLEAARKRSDRARDSRTIEGTVASASIPQSSGVSEPSPPARHPAPPSPFRRI